MAAGTELRAALRVIVWARKRGLLLVAEHPAVTRALDELERAVAGSAPFDAELSDQEVIDRG